VRYFSFDLVEPSANNNTGLTWGIVILVLADLLIIGSIVGIITGEGSCCSEGETPTTAEPPQTSASDVEVTL
jgi:hypothetical protein